MVIFWLEIIFLPSTLRLPHPLWMHLFSSFLPPCRTCMFSCARNWRGLFWRIQLGCFGSHYFCNFFHNYTHIWIVLSVALHLSLKSTPLARIVLGLLMDLFNILDCFQSIHFKMLFLLPSSCAHSLWNLDTFIEDSALYLLLCLFIHGGINGNSRDSFFHSFLISCCSSCSSSAKL